MNDHKKRLLDLYDIAKSGNVDTSKIPTDYINLCDIIAEKSYSQKGVYTVLITLLTHKTLFPNQDVRFHQSGMSGGFSGRTIDTHSITPTLKELGLPSMAESGWLTRSLEQPYPYTMEYNGKISNKIVKRAFLHILDYIESKNDTAQPVLIYILKKTIEVKNKNVVEINPLAHPENLTITKIIGWLTEHFSFNYSEAGGAKLPVLAFYAIFKILSSELKRYSGCELGELGSHNASDLTSKTAGDIEIYKGDDLFEAIEIKLDKPINANMVRIAIEKIVKYNPVRYYIFSFHDIELNEAKEINSLVLRCKNHHGCHIILNGVIPTLKYYLRLIDNLDEFIKEYSGLISIDTELKKSHKIKWNEITKKEED